MTCIAGIVEERCVYIGADSAGVSDSDLRLRADEKVFRNGNFLMGFTTSFRMGQLLRYKFKSPKHRKGKDIFEYMVSDFIDGVRECLIEGGFAKKEDNVEAGGDFLVGYQGRLFHIESDFQIAESTDGFEAVGCGGSYAKAVLWELAKKNLSADEKIKRALEAAEYFSAGVRRPFKIIKLSY